MSVKMNPSERRTMDELVNAMEVADFRDAVWMLLDEVMWLRQDIAELQGDVIDIEDDNIEDTLTAVLYDLDNQYAPEETSKMLRRALRDAGWTWQRETDE